MKITSKKGFSLRSLLLIQFLHLFVFIAGDVMVTPYVPIENITINCGSFSDSLDQDGRLWSGENHSKFPLIHLQNKPSLNLSASNGHEPYVTSRVSYSEFSYTFPLKSGRKFVRLHFNLKSHQGIDFSKALFSVKAGPITLLRNFSTLLHAQGKTTLVKEFCVNVQEDQSLDIIFTPSCAITNAHAFINGIEIVSMPINLYYSSASDNGGIPFLGKAQGRHYNLENSTALELMHRINIGGKQLSPAEDTGMYRTWLTDDPYLTIAKPSALPVNTSINLNFSTVPSYAAPRALHKTARTMGLSKAINENYSLKWEFAVDSDFDYFVRLHFCEFQPEITEAGDRVFQVYIANITAESQADVIAWSGGNGLPVYKDYVVPIGKKEKQKKQNISIALHPTPEWRTTYSDSILNGAEIFKLSRSGDLAGPNLDPLPTIRQTSKKRRLIVAAIGLISSIIAIFLLFFLVYWIRSNKLAKSNKLALPVDINRHFSLREIKNATNYFNENFIIGREGFGNVYKGFMNSCSSPVAIKRLNPGSQQGVLEFKTEIEMLSQLHHRNLVSLIGYCEDNNEMILVYDYVARGPLRDHLHNTNNPLLEWEQRLKICIGAAHGLNYLHRGPNHNSVIHRDVQTTNILLREKWVAKVSDFGLSKLNDFSNTHISTAVKGSFGYMDPEYYHRQQLTEKSDVYSFGVVLCEVLCGREPIDETQDQMQICLAEWAQYCSENGTIDQIIDPHLQGKIKPPSLLRFGEVAISCLASEGIKRPTMSEVVYGLELALQLQESEIRNDNNENHVNDSIIIDYHVLFASGSGSVLNVGR